MSASNGHLRALVLPVLLAVLVTACASLTRDVGAALDSKFRYRVNAANYGTHGVLILKPSLTETDGSVTDQWRTVRPGVPGVSADFRHFETFTGYPESLPQQLTVVWQLAVASSCSRVYKDNDHPGHTAKIGCTWTPIEGAIYRKQVDMDAIRASEAYARVGEPEEGSYLLGTYTLVIELIFNEDQLTVRTRSGSTMGYMQ